MICGIKRKGSGEKKRKEKKRKEKSEEVERAVIVRKEKASRTSEEKRK